MAKLNFEQFIKKIDQLEEANILVTALEFRIFTHLDIKGLTAPVLSRRARIQPEGAEALLNSLVSLGALKKSKKTFLNTPESYKHFCERSPEYKKGTIFLRKVNRKEWSNLTHILKKGRNVSKNDEDDPEFRKPFTYAMHERSQIYSRPLTQFVTRKSVGKLIDIGGGPGSYSAAILKHDKAAKAVLIDRPASLKIAKKILKNTSVIKRFRFQAGDLFSAEFGDDADTILYSNILHIYSESENSIIFEKINNSLKPGGRFILVDFFLKNNRTEPIDAALFSLTMLQFTATGRTYTFEETEKLLKKHGFSKFKRCGIGQGSSLIEAIKMR